MHTEGLELRIPPLVIVAATALLMWIAARALPQLIVFYSGRVVVGVGVAVLGGAAVC